MVAWSNLLLVLFWFHLTRLVIHLACFLDWIAFSRMDIKRFAGVVLDAFSVTFKFICNVDSFHDLAQEGVIYKKEKKDAPPQMKNSFNHFHFFLGGGRTTAQGSKLSAPFYPRGLRFNRPYSRKLESLTICECNYKVKATLSPQCWSGRSWTHELQQDSPMFNQLSQRCAIYLL